MQITVKFFSDFKELCGVDEVDMDLPQGTSVRELLKFIGLRFDNIQYSFEKTLIMVNEKISQRKHILEDGDVVMVLPFMGGG